MGIWDGHDAGAAIIAGGRIIAAINEERLTRRKLEITFPERAIKECLRMAELSPKDVQTVAVSTSDFSKTLTRLFPSFKEEYYLIRRRKKSPGMLSALKKKAKYKLTEIGSNRLTRAASKRYIYSSLQHLGFSQPNIQLIDHHQCHAVAAAFCSGFDSCLVVTLDGIGDALSGTISTLEQGSFNRLCSLSGRDSPGIFFEHVTNLLNMRELEDEGKVMALANYAYPIADDENPLLDFIRVEGLEMKCSYSSLGMFDALKKVLWRYPSEQFAYMAQRTLEVRICDLVSNCINKTGLQRIALSGGVFSNIKVNMLIRRMPQVQQCFVFPHMGDGGLALGAAFSRNYDLNKITAYPLEDVFQGPDYSDEEILAAIEKSGLPYRYCKNIEEETAGLIAEGGIVFWLQGKMEYGPRALGNRSILALPGSARIKDLLNMRLKMRVWYQPFCPSMLAEDAHLYLEDCDGMNNRFMTMGYMVRDEKREEMQGVISIDGSCRPQFVTGDESRYRSLLQEIKKLTGTGVVLNTSFNIHGEPLVCSPGDALATMKKTGNEFLVMGNYLVTPKRDT